MRQRVRARVGVSGEEATARARLLADKHGLALAFLQPGTVRVTGAFLRRTRFAQPVARLAGVTTAVTSARTCTRAAHPPVSREPQRG